MSRTHLLLPLVIPVFLISTNAAGHSIDKLPLLSIYDDREGGSYAVLKGRSEGSEGGPSSTRRRRNVPATSTAELKETTRFPAQSLTVIACYFGGFGCESYGRWLGMDVGATSRVMTGGYEGGNGDEVRKGVGGQQTTANWKGGEGSWNGVWKGVGWGQAGQQGAGVQGGGLSGGLASRWTLGAASSNRQSEDKAESLPTGPPASVSSTILNWFSCSPFAHPSAAQLDAPPSEEPSIVTKAPPEDGEKGNGGAVEDEKTTTPSTLAAVSSTIFNWLSGANNSSLQFTTAIPMLEEEREERKIPYFGAEVPLMDAVIEVTTTTHQPITEPSTESPEPTTDPPPSLVLAVGSTVINWLSAPAKEEEVISATAEVPTGDNGGEEGEKKSVVSTGEDRTTTQGAEVEVLRAEPINVEEDGMDEGVGTEASHNSSPASNGNGDEAVESSTEDPKPEEHLATTMETVAENARGDSDDGNGASASESNSEDHSHGREEGTGEKTDQETQNAEGHSILTEFSKTVSNFFTDKVETTTTAEEEEAKTAEEETTPPSNDHQTVSTNEEPLANEEVDRAESTTPKREETTTPGEEVALEDGEVPSNDVQTTISTKAEDTSPAVESSQGEGNDETEVDATSTETTTSSPNVQNIIESTSPVPEELTLTTDPSVEEHLPVATQSENLEESQATTSSSSPTEESLLTTISSAVTNWLTGGQDTTAEPTSHEEAQDGDHGEDETSAHPTSDNGGNQDADQEENESATSSIEELTTSATEGKKEIEDKESTQAGTESGEEGKGLAIPTTTTETVDGSNAGGDEAPSEAEQPSSEVSEGPKTTSPSEPMEVVDSATTTAMEPTEGAAEEHSEAPTTTQPPIDETTEEHPPPCTGFPIDGEVVEPESEDIAAGVTEAESSAESATSEPPTTPSGTGTGQETSIASTVRTSVHPVPHSPIVPHNIPHPHPYPPTHPHQSIVPVQPSLSISSALPTVSSSVVNTWSWLSSHGSMPNQQGNSRPSTVNGIHAGAGNNAVSGHTSLPSNLIPWLAGSTPKPVEHEKSVQGHGGRWMWIPDWVWGWDRVNGTVIYSNSSRVPTISEERVCTGMLTGSTITEERGKRTVRSAELPVRISTVDYYWDRTFIPPLGRFHILCTQTIPHEGFEDVVLENGTSPSSFAWLCRRDNECCTWECCTRGESGGFFRKVAFIFIVLIVAVVIGVFILLFRLFKRSQVVPLPPPPVYSRPPLDPSKRPVNTPPSSSIYRPETRDGISSNFLPPPPSYPDAKYYV